MPEFKLRKKVSQSKAQHVIHVITSNTEFGNNSTADCSISLKFGTEIEHVTGDTLQMLKVKDQSARSQGQRSISQRNNVSTAKPYKKGTDRLSDLNIGMGVLIKADKDRRGVGRPQVAMHRNCDIF